MGEVWVADQPEPSKWRVWTAELYEAWGKPEQAAKWRKKLKESKP